MNEIIVKEASLFKQTLFLKIKEKRVILLNLILLFLSKTQWKKVYELKTISQNDEKHKEKQKSKSEVERTISVKHKTSFLFFIPSCQSS